MDRMKRLITILDNVLDTGRKRHIIGGILLSASVFLGGLALTAMTIKNEEDCDREQHD